MEFGNRLKSLRNKKRMTQEELGKFLNVSKASISGYDNETCQPDNEALIKLAEYFNVTVDYLLGKKEILPMNIIPYDSSDMVDIPVVGTIKCGVNGLAMFDYQGKQSVNGNDLDKDSEYFWLVTSGDSMIGDGIQDGDYALVRKQSNFENGDICAIIVDGEEGTLKHITKDDFSIVLTASNPNVSPHVFVGENMNDVFIAGKLVRIMRNF